ncbi:MAG: type II toxin-antitoxin system VapC family toxin [Methanocella sp.]
MGICLDSNAMSAGKTFLNWVYGNGIYAFLPSVGYMELSYHHMKKHGHTRILDGVIDGYGIDVVPFDVELARAAATKVLLKHDLPGNAIDCAIGAFAASRDMPLITYNKKHFTWLKEVYTPEELMKKLG